MPLSYHGWKWRVLLAFPRFYLLLYLGGVNFWPMVTLASVLLDLTGSPWPTVFLSMAGVKVALGGDDGGSDGVGHG